MSRSLEPHPSKEVLLAFAEGLGTDLDLQALENHVAECEICAETLVQFDAGGGLVEDLRSAFVRSEASTDHGGETIPGRDDVRALAAVKAFLQAPTRTGSLGRLGHYEILELAGRGTFGTVFKAFDDILQRIVALKVLTPDQAVTADARDRFLREARAAAAIRHENVVQIHSVHEDPLPYLVMEFIPGENVQQRLDNSGPFSPADVARMGKQIAAGLSAAHARGLIHRDIKPGNILIDPGDEERVKITDFGLARPADDASLSQTGMIAGTPLYMSPEQITGVELDPRSDLFSLGTVFYAMLCGRSPFRGANTLAVIKSVSEDRPRPVEEIVPNAPPELCQIICRLHAKLPAERFQSAREVADALARCITSTSLPTTTSAAKTTVHGDADGTVIIPAADPDQAPNERRRKTDVATAEWSEKSPPFHWKALATWGILALTTLVALIIVRTNKSEFTIETESPDISASLSKSGGIVVEDLKTKQIFHLTQGRNRLPNGDYDLTIKTPEGLEFDASHITLKRFGTAVATIRARKATKGEPGVAALDPNNRALKFTSGRSSVEIPSLRRDDTGPLTVEMRLKITPKTEPDATLGVVFSLEGQAAWQLQPYPGDRLASVERGTGEEPVLIAQFTPGVWHHVACVLDEREHRIYLNGHESGRSPRLPATQASPLGVENSSVTMLGSQLFGDDRHYHGMDGAIDEVRVSKTARYNENFTPAARFTNDKDTIALYHCDEGRGDVLQDSSGHKHHGKLVGVKWILFNDPGPDAQTQEGAHGPSVTRANGPAPGRANAPFDALQAAAHQAAWAEYLDVPVELTNTHGMKFRLIPPGAYQQGSPTEEVEETVQQQSASKGEGNERWLKCFRSETPPRSVSIAEPFYLGTHEVVQRQYELLMDRNPGHFTSWAAGGKLVPGDTSRHPVEMVNWTEAVEFCGKLNQIEQHPLSWADQRKVTSPVLESGYRLPTEAEWEFACRAGSGSSYFFGDDPMHLSRYAWSQENSSGHTHPIGELQPNPFGLHDVYGNVWEWCLDVCEPPIPTEPGQPGVRQPAQHISKGGGLKDPPFRARSAVRNPRGSDARNFECGFRVVLTLDAARRLLKDRATRPIVDAQRELAHYLVSHNAAFDCAVTSTGQESREVTSLERIPTQPFRIHAVSLRNATNQQVKEVVDLAAGRVPFNIIYLSNGNGTTRVTGASLKELLRLPDLDNVGLDHLSDTQPAEIAALAQLPKLQVLNLGHMSIGDEVLKRIGNFSHVTYLLLNYCDVTDDGLLPLTQSHLNRLYLSSDHLTDRACEILGQMPNLEDLTIIADRKFTGAKLDLLSGLPLHRIHLAELGLRDDSLKSLGKFPRLETLLLRENHLTDAALAHLVGLPIKSLELREGLMTKDAIERLHEALPQCEIESNFGILPASSLNYSQRLGEWIVDQGGAFYAVISDSRYVTREITKREDVPAVPFHIQSLRIIGMTGPQVTALVELAAGKVVIENVYLTGQSRTNMLPGTILKELTRLPELGNIAVSNANLTRTDIAEFQKFLFLTNLGIGDTKLPADALLDLPGCKRLRILVLNDCDVTDQSVQPLGEMPALENVYLNSPHLTEEVWKTMARLPKLNRLDLISGSKITGEGLQLVQDRQWDAIIIKHTGLQDEALRHLAGFKSIRSLILSCNSGVTDAGLKHLGAVLQLESLNLEGSNIGNAGLSELVPLTHLTVLSLTETHVNDAGLEAVARIASLQELNLANLPITDAGLKHLEKLQRLTKLNLEKTQVTAQGVESFRTALPACEINWSPPPK